MEIWKTPVRIGNRTGVFDRRENGDSVGVTELDTFLLCEKR